MSVVVARGLVFVGLLASAPVARAQTSQHSEPMPVKPLRFYLRAGRQPVTFSERAKTSSGTPTWCIAPCNVELAPGDYQLKLNGVLASDSLLLRRSGTLSGQYHSRETSRSVGWLALNMGGILGGVFVTVAALGGPSWAYVAGGGSLAAGGLIFLVTYRADSASVSFSPGEPIDMRGMSVPESQPSSRTGSEFRDRLGLASQGRGLGLRVAF
jgi:hypothetical protein